MLGRIFKSGKERNHFNKHRISPRFYKSSMIFSIQALALAVSIFDQIAYLLPCFVLFQTRAVLERVSVS